MDAYTSFAPVYDLFMEDVPYDLWADEIRNALTENGISDGLVCELGCGTGQITRRLAQAGFDMIGIDNSPEMLDEAYAFETARGAKPGEILYLLQDIREFELYGTVRACVAVCDTMNYITDPEDLTEVFRLVNNYLDPDGVFFFDLRTPAFYEKIGSSVIAENREEASFIWENEYDAETRENEYRMTFFVREGELYRKTEEIHEHRAYTIEDVKACAEEAGLIFLSAKDAETGKEAGPETERLYVLLKECGKKQ